jgi:hypothetical protein
MEKKKYVVPNMVVVELKHRQAPLLLFSGEQGYIPNMGNDELNKLA